MNDEDILYQTYLVTLATAITLLRSADRARLGFLVRDIEHRQGFQRYASELALDDAGTAVEIRSRAEVLHAILERSQLRADPGRP